MPTEREEPNVREVSTRCLWVMLRHGPLWMKRVASQEIEARIARNRRAGGSEARAKLIADAWNASVERGR